jgi:hypothetical protein
MHVKTSLISMVPTFIAFSHAIIVPEDLPQGRYSISLTNKNASIPVLAAGQERFTTLVTLPHPSVGCASYSTFQNDANFARNELNAWCNAGNVVRETSAALFSYGSAIAYICNYAGSTNPCSGDEFDVVNQLISSDCGGSTAGWVLINDWGKGYGRDNKGVRICSWDYPTG